MTEWPFFLRHNFYFHFNSPMLNCHKLKSGGDSMKTLTVIAIISFVFAAGCASPMQKYVGGSIQQVMIDYGEPQSSFDVGGGIRAFQWTRNGSITTPTVIRQNSLSTTAGTINSNMLVGSTIYATPAANLNANTFTNSHATVSGGQTVNFTSRKTFFARFDEASGGWVVVDFKAN
jgi:hypothetical protein